MLVCSLQCGQRLKRNAPTIICCLFWLPVCHTECDGDYLLQYTVVPTCRQMYVCALLPESTGRPARRRKTKQKQDDKNPADGAKITQNKINKKD